MSVCVCVYVCVSAVYTVCQHSPQSIVSATNPTVMTPPGWNEELTAASHTHGGPQEPRRPDEADSGPPRWSPLSLQAYTYIYTQLYRLCQPPPGGEGREGFSL